MSAVSLCERVAAERHEAPGKTVGYRVRFDTRVSEETCIEYNTTELLIRRLLSEGLQDVTHVVIDERHERSLFVDLLLLLLKLKLLEKNPENVKIIVMSATIHVNAFAEYFRSVCSVGVVEIPVATYPVSAERGSDEKIRDLFLEDVLEVIEGEEEEEEDDDDSLVCEKCNEFRTTDVTELIRHLGQCAGHAEKQASYFKVKKDEDAEAADVYGIRPNRLTGGRKMGA